eukprot:TRINITY_DN26068_c0_g1_i1.p3 TRINITY_DN26068_c0_g1~~TRINITY_DN26068_c0_g1_i1.p3  ORF type:complete len:138 (+),score=6.08 TRINITY_DN26068_c0_g1_i1:136-549(+)
MIRRPPRSTQGVSSAASDVYKRQLQSQQPLSLGVFLYNLCVSLSAFAERVSIAKHFISCTSIKNTDLLSTAPTHGRLRCSEFTLSAGVISLCVHNKSPRRQGHRPHAIADRPILLTPRISPRLGVRRINQELHRYAL